jgi:short-subunit dehydrogenase
MKQVVVVIGATGGLGTAIAQAFARRGAQLVLVGRREAALQTSAQALGVEAVWQVADVTAPGALEQVSQVCRDRFGRVDVVVNATGYDVRRAFTDHTVDEVRQLIEVDLIGSIWITRAFLPQMLDQHDGVILHLGGFADGRLAFPYYSVDSAARAGLRGFVDALNREYEGSGVTLTYFCPAPADTEAERPYHELWRAMGTAIVPPEQVADAVVAAVEQCKRVVVMGTATRLFAWINNLSSTLADGLLMRRYRRLLQNVFAPTRSA